jgi:hypothetical protein
MSQKFSIPSRVEKKCSLKCSLFYNYPESPNITINRGKNVTTASDYSYIFINTDDITSKTPVLYNSKPYVFKGIYMYNGGIHKYGTATPVLEVVIKHTASTGESLYLCIPVFSTSSNTSVNLVDKMIQAYDSSTTGSVYIQSFNLGYIIPKSTYFTHTGAYRRGDSASDVYVTFPPNSLYLNQGTLDKFIKMCKSAYSTTYSYSTMTVYQNDKGTTENGFSGEGQIYIDCQPTDSEGEIVFKATGNAALPPINVKTMLSVLFSILFFIFSLYMLRVIKTYFLDYSDNDVKVKGKAA